MKTIGDISRSWLGLTAFYALLSLATLLVFSFSTSPLWPNIAFDQAIFSAIGRNWAEGQLPYVTAWDSKGPIIFFFNMLGHKLSNGETGTFVLQAVNMTLVLLLSFCLLQRHCQARRALCYTLLLLLAHIIVNGGGNTVGDWTLLLAVPSVMGIYEWTLGLEQQRYAHPWRWSVVYGMFVAACLLSRLTNGVLVMAAMGVVAAVLLWQGLWLNLLKNAGGFLLGFAVVFVPFAAYFALHGTFGEMWYAAVAYNVEYALHSSHAAEDEGWIVYAKDLFFYFTVVATLLTAVLSLLLRERRRVAVVWLTLSALTSAWLLKGYAYPHYVISFLPVLFVALLELSALKKAHRVVRHVSHFVAFVIVAGAVLKGGLAVRAYPAVPEEYEAQSRMVDIIPKGEPCVLYNTLPSLYLKHDLRLCYPYFVCQDWAVENGASLRKRVHECFASGRARWILVSDLSEQCAIRDILLRYYKPVKKDEANHLILYRRRDV